MKFLKALIYMAGEPMNRVARTAAGGSISQKPEINVCNRYAKRWIPASRRQPLESFLIASDTCQTGLLAV